MSVNVTTTAQVKARKGEKVSDELTKLLADGFVVVDAFGWYTGANYGGESPDHVGYIINLEKVRT